MAADAAKTALTFFFAAIFQVTIVSSIELGGGTADLVLVTLAAVALLRGSVFGALAGFYAGFLLDAANLETLGLSSLLLTLAGYWIGRYGETTGREPGRPSAANGRLSTALANRRIGAHAPLLAIAVVTVLYAVGELGLYSMLGEPVSARAGLEALPAQILFNLALTIPVYALCRRVFALPRRVPVQEVEFG